MKHWILATLIWIAVAAAPAAADSHSDATQEVVMSHMKAVGQRDVNAYVDGYAEDAKIVTPSRVYSGHSEIREFAEAWLAEFSGPDVAVNIQSLTFEGDTAIVVFSADTAENVYEIVVETFLVSDGRIATQTYVVEVSPRNRPQS